LQDKLTAFKEYPLESDSSSGSEVWQYSKSLETISLFKK
jgi:hypothetical protein